MTQVEIPSIARPHKHSSDTTKMIDGYYHKGILILFVQPQKPTLNDSFHYTPAEAFHGNY
jgi:hypothetical protein